MAALPVVAPRPALLGYLLESLPLRRLPIHRQPRRGRPAKVRRENIGKRRPETSQRLTETVDVYLSLLFTRNRNEVSKYVRENLWIALTHC